MIQGLSADESSKKANEQAQSAFVGSTRLHFVWTEILDVYYGKPDLVGPKSKKAKFTSGPKAALSLVPFLEFYQVVLAGEFAR